MDLSDYALLDSHCHPIWREDPPDYSTSFSQAHNHDARHGLFFRRSRQDMAELLECPPDQVEEKRRELGQEALFRKCVGQTEELLLDDGLTPELCHPREWHAKHVKTRRLLRIEQLAQQLYTPSYREFIDSFVQELETTDACGLKSIAAYRTGLEIEPDGPSAEPAFQSWHGERLALKPLNDTLVSLAMERGKTIQFHTGFGDPDLDLRTSNPLCLRKLIERHPKTPIVLLHACYPFAREAGFLASVYPNVYLDFGLALPFLSVAGMQRTLSELLELGPLSKLTWSSDASRIPDLYYLGALWGKRILGRVLDECVHNRDLTAQEAEEAARAILSENARGLYRGRSAAPE